MYPGVGAVKSLDWLRLKIINLNPTGNRYIALYSN